MKGYDDFIYIKNVPSSTLGHGNLMDVDVDVDAKRGDQFGYQIGKIIK